MSRFLRVMPLRRVGLFISSIFIMAVIISTDASAALVQMPGDCDGNGSVSIAEVQSSINMFLGLKQVLGCVDVDANASVSISETQKVINSFLGLNPLPAHLNYTTAMLAGYAFQTTSISPPNVAIYNVDGTFLYLSSLGNVPGTWKVQADGTLLVTFIDQSTYTTTLQQLNGTISTVITVNNSAGPASQATQSWDLFLPPLQYTTASLSGKTFQSVTAAGTVTVTFNADNTFSATGGTGAPSGNWSINPDGSLQLNSGVNQSAAWARHILQQINADGSATVLEINGDGSVFPNTIWTPVAGG